MRILIAGGNGFIGHALVQHFHQHEHECIVLSRQQSDHLNPLATIIHWNGHEPGPWIDELGNIDVVVNLAGRSVDCAKTPANCDAILRSRVDSTRCLRQVCAQLEHPPRIWLQMSTAHIYGDPQHQYVDEDATHGYGLAPTVGQAWEAACDKHPIAGCRDIFMRTSFVLGRSGGAFPTLVWLTRFGLGGKIGDGKQGISWIHINDFCQLCTKALEDDSMNGVYNFTAPNPVSQHEFMRAIRRCNGHLFGLPSPALLVRLGSWLMGRDPELALAGRYCISKRIAESAFTFPTIDQAIRDLNPAFFAGWR